MVGLRDINSWFDRTIGLAGVDEELAGKIRAEQVAATIKLTPAMMAGNFVTASAFLYFTWDSQHFVLFWMWAALLSCLITSALSSWEKNRSVPKRKYASAHATNRIAINGAILGAVWGLLPILTTLEGSLLHRVIAGVIISGMICGGGFAFAPTPKAVVAYITPIVIGSIFMMAAAGTYVEIVFIVITLTYVGIVLYASLAHARIFVERIKSKAKADERGDLISILLKDFEDNASDWLWATDADGVFRHISSRFSKACEIDATDLSKTSFLQLLNRRVSRRHEGFARLIRTLRNKDVFRDLELPVVVKGEVHWWNLTGQPQFDNAGEFAGYRGVGADITERKMAEERVSFLAQNDDLTGLANRTRFTKLLKRQLRRLQRYGDGFTVFYVDIDRFKAVNDTRGHEFGDKLLMAAAQRFLDVVSEQDTVARLGGDEFAILCVNLRNRDDAAELAQRVIQAISVPAVIGDQTISISASVGIAIAPEDGLEADDLLRHADLALYRAKQDGRHTYRFFEPGMDWDTVERRNIEFALNGALTRGELELYFQPLVCVDGGETTGFEALVRWTHPELGSVPPAKFVPVAEQSGAIHAIGKWVLFEACRIAANWPKDFVISVNLSPRQFESGDLCQVVESALAASGLEPNKLELEVTESVLVDKPDEVLETLNHLKEIGVSIAMDDFGTGYSSLSYLLKFPFDKIKIDQSFVSVIERDLTARNILRTIGSLGNSLNMKITAEGVETEEQVAFLRNISCDLLQGYYFARPLPEPEVAGYLLNNLSEKLMMPTNTKDQDEITEQIEVSVLSAEGIDTTSTGRLMLAGNEK